MAKSPKPRKKFKTAVAPQPLWDWTKGLTQSAITNFLNCREQFALSYVEGWTPTGFSVPLEFGSMIHLAIERWAATSAAKTSKKTALDIICEITESYHNARAASLKREDIAAMSKTIAAAEALFPEYAQAVAADDSRQQWVAHEQLFGIEHQFTDCEIVDRVVVLRGVRDGVYRTKAGLGLFETKTRAMIDPNRIQAALRADLQTLFYLFTLSLETKETPRQVLYNVIRRPGQKFLDRDNYASFKSRIQADIKSRPSYYFQRFEVEVQPTDLEVFRDRVLDPALRQIIHWWESVMDHPFDRFRSPYHSINLNALVTKYGLCGLYEMIVLGNRHNYVKRSSPFPELENGH